jgi:hypothetical protein
MPRVRFTSTKTDRRFHPNPVETLEAGADARYTITAKVQGDGDVIFKATSNSDSLRSETTSEEPKRLFSGQAAN